MVSIGVTFAIGVALSRRAVERANLDDLAHQADLISQRENESDVLLPFSRLERLQPFLEKQNQQIKIVDLDEPSAYLEGEHLADVRARRPAEGTTTVDGETYLFAARNVQGRGFVLLRPKTLSFADWQPFLLALLIAGAIAAGLAAIGSFLTARAIARPVRRVAEASRSLAEGVSPDPVPVEGSAELALLATSFNEMAEQLQKAREAERNFLLSVSHELKTPLTAIRGYAEALEDGAVPPEEAAATIREEGRRLERLVRDLLDLARMNRREFAVDAEQINLAEIGREAVRRYEGEARAGGIELDAFADEEATATGDPDRCCRSCRTSSRTRSVDATRRLRTGARGQASSRSWTPASGSPPRTCRTRSSAYLHDRVGIPTDAAGLRPRSCHRQGALRAHGRLGRAGEHARQGHDVHGSAARAVAGPPCRHQ